MAPPHLLHLNLHPDDDFLCNAISWKTTFSDMAKVTHPGRPKDEDPHVKCTTKNKKEVNIKAMMLLGVSVICRTFIGDCHDYPWGDETRKNYENNHWGDWIHRPWRSAGGAWHWRDDLRRAESSLWAFWLGQVGGNEEILTFSFTAITFTFHSQNEVIKVLFECLPTWPL